MWKKEDSVGTQPTPTMATYSEAMDRFTRSGRAFMEDVHHLTQARVAYQEAMVASTAIRNSLDAGDQGRLERIERGVRGMNNQGDLVFLL